MKDFKKFAEENDLKKLIVSKTRIYNQGSSEAVWSSEYLFKEIFINGKEFLKPSFIYALCSIIEENFNCILIDFFQSKFGDNYKIFAATHIKMAIHDKLCIVIPTISNFKYQLNQEKKEIKIIKQLFEVRNQMIHIKNHYRKTLYYETKSGKHYIEELDEKELNIYDSINYKKLDKRRLKQFYNAQKEFTPTFHMLFHRMKRKNFNPKDWFFEIKKTEDKIVVKR